MATVGFHASQKQLSPSDLLGLDALYLHHVGPSACASIEAFGAKVVPEVTTP